MDKILKESAREYHRKPKPGKISITPTTPLTTQRDLALAYSPGVAVPCEDIAKDPQRVNEYTSRSNLVAVVTNGTAVLGLGNIGPLAAKPVMEGKCVLFKKFAAIDSIDIEIDETDIDMFVETVARLEPSFGGINLEDIKAPECFEIEERLKKITDIPIMHDDQHGTAIVTAAGLLNACKLTNREPQDLKVVIVGSGAAAIASARMYSHLGVKNIILIDSKGVVHKKREDLNRYKQEFAYESEISREEAFKDADMVLGLSVPGAITQDDIKVMKNEPFVFVCSNPIPEIMPDIVKKIKPNAIIATGRSDFPNQVNNVLGFPYLFRGALDVRSRAINYEMMLAAAYALAELARKEVPDYIKEIYGKDLKFSKEYIIPTPFDKRLIVEVSSAVAEAAMKSKVARIKKDIKKYKKELEKRVTQA